MASIDEDIIAALRARVTELERHAGLLRDSRAEVCGTLASIHAALDGRPTSKDEPEVVQRVARVVAELAEAKRDVESAHGRARTWERKFEDLDGESRRARVEAKDALLRAEADANRAVAVIVDLAERLDRAGMTEAVKMAREAHARAIGADRPPCPGEGWAWDEFARRWYQPGAKGKAIG